MNSETKPATDEEIEAFRTSLQRGYGAIVSHDRMRRVLDRITAERERAERAEAENGRLTRAWESMQKSKAESEAEAKKWFELRQKEHQAAQQQIAALREALEPFRKQADGFNGTGPHSVPDDFRLLRNLTVGHLRHARAVLTNTDKG